MGKKKLEVSVTIGGGDNLSILDEVSKNLDSQEIVHLGATEAIGEQESQLNYPEKKEPIELNQNFTDDVIEDSDLYIEKALKAKGGNQSPIDTKEPKPNALIPAHLIFRLLYQLQFYH